MQIHAGPVVFGDPKPVFSGEVFSLLREQVCALLRQEPVFRILPVPRICSDPGAFSQRAFPVLPVSVQQILQPGSVFRQERQAVKLLPVFHRKERVLQLPPVFRRREQAVKLLPVFHLEKPVLQQGQVFLLPVPVSFRQGFFLWDFPTLGVWKDQTP